MDGENEEIDEPAERVLVHRVDVREICNREEQDRAVLRDRSVVHTRCFDFLRGLLGHLLLLLDLV